jgi:hypothetical protein
MKLCECGCGQPTSIAKENRPRNGYVKGEPVRFVRGHKSGPQPPYIVSASGCWLWQGYLNADGYGSLGHRAAHRLYYERHVGAIPPGLTLDHTCGVRSCVNPDHLEPVTQGENVRRGNRAKLTAEIVAEIRQSTESHAALGRRYGVHPTRILRVRRGQAWRDESCSA